MKTRFEAALQKASPVPLDKLIKKYRKAIFIYDSSEGDERYFKEGITDFIQRHVTLGIGPDPETWRDQDGELFRQHVINMIWERNKKGVTTKYMYFSDKSQRVYLDNTVWEWAKIVAHAALQVIATMRNNETIR